MSNFVEQQTPAFAFPIPVVKLRAEYDYGPGVLETHVALAEPGVDLEAVRAEFSRTNSVAIPIAQQVGLRTLVSAITLDNHLVTRPTRISYPEQLEVDGRELLLTDYDLERPADRRIFAGAIERVGNVAVRGAPQGITILDRRAFTTLETMLSSRREEFDQNDLSLAERVLARDMVAARAEVNRIFWEA